MLAALNPIVEQLDITWNSCRDPHGTCWDVWTALEALKGVIFGMRTGFETVRASSVSYPLPRRHVVVKKTTDQTITICIQFPTLVAPEYDTAIVWRSIAKYVRAES